MKMVKKQGGFTLVEIAIVLVIVGLLLAGVLKGQELIENSRIKNMAKDLDSMTAIISSYQDRYSGVPGDDMDSGSGLARGWAGGTVFPGPGAVGLNNGLIGLGAATAIFPPAAASENMMAIRALRYSGFIQGDATLNTLPSNAAGGFISLTNNVFGLGQRNVVCLSGLTGKQAGAIDRQLDDGINNSGNVRAAVLANPASALAPALANYVEATPGWIVCKSI